MKNYEEYINFLEDIEDKYFLKLEEEEKRDKKALKKWLQKNKLENTKENIIKYIASINYKNIVTNEDIEYFTSL